MWRSTREDLWCEWIDRAERLVRDEKGAGGGGMDEGGWMILVEGNVEDGGCMGISLGFRSATHQVT